MMVGEGARTYDINAAGLEGGKESRGVADAGEGQHALILKLCNRRFIRLEMRTQHRLALRSNSGRHRLGGGAIADNDERIGAPDLRPQRRTQATCRKHLPVAEAAVTVDHA